MKLGPGVLVAERYRIERELGRGGMGSVYVAHDTKFDERVALKIAAASGAAHEEFEKRFAREARIGHRLGKLPGFVRAIDWGKLPDGIRLYLAMDLVDDARPLDLSTGSREERLGRLLDAARLVAEAHRNGIVHRDLKPANFLQGPTGEIHLTDFGLAKTQDEEEPSSVEELAELTRTGIGLGTPNYMAPEQFDDAKTAGERADVYSLGVMLFKALTGEVPFPGGKAMKIWNLQEQVRLGKRPAPRPSAHDASLPADLDALCADAVALERDQRPNSAAFVARLSEALAAGVGEPPEADVESQALTTPPAQLAPEPTTPPPGAPASGPVTPVPPGPATSASQHPVSPPQAETATGTGAAFAAATTHDASTLAPTTEPPAPRLPSWLLRAAGCCAGATLLGLCCLSGLILDVGGVQGSLHHDLGSLTAAGYGALPGGLVAQLDGRPPELELVDVPRPVDWTLKDQVTLEMRVREASLAGLELEVRTADGVQVLPQPFPARTYRVRTARTLELPEQGLYRVTVRAFDQRGNAASETYEVWRFTDARRLVLLNSPRTANGRTATVWGQVAVPRLVDYLTLDGRRKIAVDADGRFRFKLRRPGFETRTYRLYLSSPSGEQLDRSFKVEWRRRRRR